MIVKDEAHVIERCLASVRPILDHWVIVDTGSTDGTQDIIRAVMTALPGELVERPWIDFAANRSEALALARPNASYSIIIDADDELHLPPDFALPALDADSYTIDIHYGATTYRRPQLVRNALAWRYRGVLHEFLECAEAQSSGHLPIVMKINHEGSRSTDPTTYAKDAAILATALETESDPFLVSRYTFYLAQSYRDCGEHEKALAAYLARADLGFWHEERYVALLGAARLQEELGRPDEEIIATYARAHHIAPARAEAQHGASRFCRAKDRFEDGYWWAQRGLGLTQPPDSLFAEPWIYDYGLLDECAVHAYWSGRYAECLSACDQLLSSGKMPESMHERVEANRRFAVMKLGADRPRSFPTRPPPTPDENNADDGVGRPFIEIYESDGWSHGSGPGSRPVNTIEYRALVERFIAANDIRTVTDLGCGDWQFSQAMDWSNVAYTGFDVVPSIIEANRTRFAREGIAFEYFRSIADLPGGDLLLAKEMLQHLPTPTIKAYVAAICRKYRFALLTNTVEPKSLANTAIDLGGYRPLRLDEAPFHIPGATILTYEVKTDNYIFQNAVFLVTGEPARGANAPAALPRRDGSSPRVLVAILAKQKERVLPLYLECLEKLDYPKSAIVLYIRTNNSTDRTREILRDWVDRVKDQYAHVEMDDTDVAQPVESFGVHEWNETRFKVLAEIRNVSLRKTIEHRCSFYFTADVDNFVGPETLRDLVALNLPIVAPFLRHVDASLRYSNYHADIDAAGYFKESSLYDRLWAREIVGVVELPVVHCTYLIRADVIPRLGYDDRSGRHEYVVFSERARRQGVAQYLDNRRIYGLLTLNDDKPDQIAREIATIRSAMEDGILSY